MVHSSETNLTQNEDLLTSLNIDLVNQLFLNNYVSFLQNHPDLTLVFSTDGQLLTKNLDAIYHKLAITSTQNINFADIIPNEQFKSLIHAFNNVKNGKVEQERLQFNMKTNDNEQLYITATFIPIKSLQNQIIGISIIAEDITEKVYLESALNQTNKDFKNIFDQIHSGTWIWDVKNKKLDFVSKGLAEILDIPLKKLYKNTNFLVNAILPEYRESFAAKNYLLEQGKPVDRTFQIKTGKNVKKWIHEQTIPTVAPTGEVTHYFGRIIDITEEIELKRKLEYLAKHDAVTNLPNNHQLQEKLDTFIADKEVKRFAILSVDLDNFQWITDYLGYKFSDEVMKIIAERFVKICPVNGFLSKGNYDSFTFVLINYKNENEVISFIEKVMHFVAQIINVSGYEFYITSSIGVTYYPKHGTDKLVLLENAQSALHYAKKIGKNNYQIFSSNRDIRSHKKYHLEKDLRKAIENSEFSLHFQPQVNSKTNEIVGAEALIRWNHKEWGIVSPEEFIQIAEKKHLIDEIGNWVIHSVCEQLNNWRKQGLKLIPISINISPIQLLKPGLIETIKEALETYNISAEFLVIEITEGTLLQKEDFILQTLNEIRQLGIKIALDDFGTGYATFQDFQTFDLDILKIDRSFIQKLFTNDIKASTALAIVSSFLYFAKSLGVTVTAEGVEELEQLKYLAKKECDIIQGYIFSRPLPIDEFEKILQKKYLKPVDQRKARKPSKEQRKYYRFKFPSPVPVKIFITKIGQNKLNVGYTTGLIENISLGGIRVLSSLRLPLVSELNYQFEFEVMGQKFTPNGSLVYKNDEKQNIYSYGVSFQMAEVVRDQLSKIMNQMTILEKLNQQIPDTPFVDEKPVMYFQNK